MGKTILVTGKENFLGNEIAQHFLNQGCQVAAALSPRKEAAPAAGAERRLVQLPWSSNTPAAAKNLILQTVRTFDSLDEAWIIVTPEREAYSLTDLAPPAVDGGVDAVKGTLYLVRELLARQTPQLPTLRFVFFDEDPAGLPPLAAVQYHGLRGLVTSLLAQAKKRGQIVWAYETLVPRADEYLSYILSSKAPVAGRWNVLGERRNLVNSLFSRKENA
jgi:NAD(P)-dependent dehydrogenase (short-subunit alcohol dehydrogenase family)